MYKILCATIILFFLLQPAIAEDSKTIRITEDHPVFQKIKENIPPIVRDADLEVTCKIYTKPNTGYLEVKTLSPHRRIDSFYYRADVTYGEHGAIVTSTVDLNLRRGHCRFLNRLRGLIERIAERIILEEQAKLILDAGQN
jgi:hypothetical protein